MHLVNGTQLLNITLLFLSSARLVGASPPAPVIAIASLTSMCASEKSHKIDLSIVVLNLISLPVVYPPLGSSFTSTEFFVLNLDGVDLMLCRLKNLLFFDIPLLYCYTNLNPSIICCLSSGDMNLFFGTSISSSECDF